MKVKLFFSMIIGNITVVVGLISLSVYFGIFFGAPLFKDVLNITLYSSRWVLAFCSFLTLSGLFVQFSAMRFALDGRDFALCSLATVTSAVTLGITSFKTMILGFDWIGRELLGNQLVGRHESFRVLGIFALVYTFLLFIYSGSMMIDFSSKK